MDARDVEKLFELAKIEIEKEDLEKFPHELNSILGYVSKLKEASLGGIPPLLSLVPENNMIRKDVPTDTQFEGREQFPESEEGYLKTKKVFGNG